MRVVRAHGYACPDCVARRLRVRDAEGRVVDVPDVDGVLSALTEVDDDERELMWESMMGSPNSK